MISLVIATVVFIILFAFWLKSLSSNIKDISATPRDPETVAPFDALGNNLSQIISSFKQGIEGIKSDISPATESSQVPEESGNTLVNQGGNDIIDSNEGEGNQPK